MRKQWRIAPLALCALLAHARFPHFFFKTRPSALFSAGAFFVSASSTMPGGIVFLRQKKRPRKKTLSKNGRGGGFIFFVQPFPRSQPFAQISASPQDIFSILPFPHGQSPDQAPLPLRAIVSVLYSNSQSNPKFP